MDYKHIEKKDYRGKTVKMLDETYEPGIPEISGCGENTGWRTVFDTREDKIKYLKSGERYWYSKEWFGSEKRK
jgi:hypothetical protein